MTPAQAEATFAEYERQEREAQELQAEVATIERIRRPEDGFPEWWNLQGERYIEGTNESAARAVWIAARSRR